MILKRMAAIILAAAFMLSTAAYAAVDNRDNVPEENNADGTNGISNIWTVSSTRGNVSVSEDDRDIVLSTELTSTRNVASAYAQRSFTVSPSDGDTVLSFSLQTDGFSSDKQTGTVSVTSHDGTKSAEILSIADKTLTVFKNSEMSEILTDKAEVDIKIVFNAQNGNAAVKIGESEFKITGSSDIKALYDDNSEEIPLNLSLGHIAARVKGTPSITFRGINISVNEKFLYKGLFAKNAEIGDYCEKSSLDDGIVISFAGLGAAKMYDKENYIFTVNGENTEFILYKTDSGVMLAPTYTFSGGEEVSLRIVSIEDIYGKLYSENEFVTFKIFSDGYESPKVELTCADTQLYVGQSAVIDVLLSGTAWSYAEVYVNGSYKEQIEHESFTYNFAPMSAGEYTLKFVVVDSTYNMSSDKEIAVKFEKNDAPSITILGYSDGDLINVFDGSEGTLEFTVVDDLGIEKTEIYVNEVIKQNIDETSYSFDLSVLPLGTSNILIKTYDIYGRSAEIGIIVLKSKESSSELFRENDFERLPDGARFERQRGYLKTGTADERYGTSLLIGVDENMDVENFTGDQYTFVQYERNAGYPIQKAEFDINMTKRPTMDIASLNFALRCTDGTILTLFSVKQSEFLVGNISVPYNEGEWYHVSLTVANSYYIASVEDMNGNKFKSASCEIDTSKEIGIYRLHVASGWRPKNLFDAAVDNIVISEVARSLSIIGIGNADERYTEVPAGAKSFRLYTDGSAVSGDINKNNISLFNGKQHIEINKIRHASADGFIEIYTEEPLAASTQYTVILSGKIRFREGESLGEDIAYRFNTSDEGMRISNVSKSLTRNGIKLTIDALNLDSTEKNVFIFVSECDKDGKALKTTVFEQSLPADSVSHKLECEIENADKSEISIFVTDGINIGRIYYTGTY